MLVEYAPELRAIEANWPKIRFLCRTITRPTLANERVQCNAAGQVVLHS